MSVSTIHQLFVIHFILHIKLAFKYVKIYSMRWNFSMKQYNQLMEIDKNGAEFQIFHNNEL